MFFISKISAKGGHFEIQKELYVQTIIKQLKFHRKLTKMDLNLETLISKQKNTDIKNRAELGKALISSNFLTKPENLKNIKPKDKPQVLYRYLIRNNESDVLTMIKQIEDDIDEDMIKEFLKDADQCPMYMVIVYLHQILLNYQKCLSMFFKIKIIKSNVFGWLQDIQANILMAND